LSVPDVPQRSLGRLPLPDSLNARNGFSCADFILDNLSEPGVKCGVWAADARDPDRIAAWNADAASMDGRMSKSRVMRRQKDIARVLRDRKAFPPAEDGKRMKKGGKKKP